MSEVLKKYFTNIELWANSPTGKTILNILKYALQAGIILILIYQIIDIGLGNILSHLPTHPLFYVFFFLLYFTLPITEYFTYNVSWKIGFWESQSIFLKKRIYNKTVLGYSGEVQLFFWLEKHVGVPKKEAFKIVRDNNTLSTLASTFVAISLLSVFFFSGQLAIFDWITVEISTYVIVLLIAVVVILILFKRLRQMLFSMNRQDSFKIFGLHSLRMFMLTIFQVLQWYVVLPEVGFQIWFTLVAMQLILSRVPFLPNKDLIFIGAGLEFGQNADIPVAALAGLLLVNHVLDKLLNLMIFAFYAIQEKKKTVSTE